MQTVVTKRVKDRLTEVFNRQSGSYIVIGQEGSGKFTAVSELAQGKSASAYNLIVIEPDGASIGIDQIHDLVHQLSLKEVANGRVVIVRDAHLLTREAQNAFLKTLEEPPIDTLMILTVADRSLLLPTVISRCQTIEFGALERAAIKTHLTGTLSLADSQADELLALSQNVIGRAVALSQSDHLYAEQKLIETAASQLLETDDLYVRLKSVLNLEGQIDTQTLLAAIEVRLHTDLRANIARSNRKPLAKRLAQLSLVGRLRDYLYAHGNAKLALIYLALNLE